MKNLFYSIMCLAAMVFAVSCDKGPDTPEGTKLTAPVLGEPTTTENSFTIAWQAVEGAVNYTYMVNGENPTDIDALTVTVSDLAPGTYNFRVKANAEDKTLSSAWAQTDIKIAEAVIEKGTIEDFCGTFDFTAMGEVVGGANGLEYNEEASDPYTSTLSIKVLPEEENVLEILGWLPAGLSEQPLPVYGFYDYQVGSEEEHHNVGHMVGLFNDFPLSDKPDADGYTPTLSNMAMLDGDPTNLSVVSGQFSAVDIQQTKEGLAFTMMEGELTNGKTFSSIMYHLFAFPANPEDGLLIYTEGQDAPIPAAPYAAVKVDSKAAVKSAAVRDWSKLNYQMAETLKVSRIK